MQDNNFDVVALAIARLNWIANDLDILPYIAQGYESIDLAHFFDNPDNACIFAGDGAILFAAMGEGRFETHFLLPKSMTGIEKLAGARNAIREMFVKHNATMLCGKTPVEHRHARRFNKALGAKQIGEGKDTAGRDIIFYVLERKQWAKSSAA